MARIEFPDAVRSEAPPELEATLAGVTLRGSSVAARATAFALPELGVALDLGRLSPAIAAQPVVLLSHAHLDHLSAVLAYLNLRARFFRAAGPPRLLVPVEVAEPLTRALQLFPGMASVRKRLELDGVISGVRPGEAVELPWGRARAFAQDHTQPSLGWVLERRGEERPLLVYGGDGTTAAFAARPDLLDARVAVVECSQLERNRRVAAHLSGHAHLADWLELAPRLACDVLVLAHLPPAPATLLAELAAPLAAELAGRLVLWVAPEA